MTAQTTSQMTGAAAWLLVGSEGLWAADCLVPGCGWTVTTGACDAALTAGLSHADSHAATHTIMRMPDNREVSQ
jgi:hypothetical protein